MVVASRESGSRRCWEEGEDEAQEDWECGSKAQKMAVDRTNGTHKSEGERSARTSESVWMVSGGSHGGAVG